MLMSQSSLVSRLNAYFETVESRHEVEKSGVTCSEKAGQIRLKTREDETLAILTVARSNLFVIELFIEHRYDEEAAPDVPEEFLMREELRIQMDETIWPEFAARGYTHQFDDDWYPERWTLGRTGYKVLTTIDKLEQECGLIVGCCCR